jgi:hypothetical protein
VHVKSGKVLAMTSRRGIDHGEQSNYNIMNDVITSQVGWGGMGRGGLGWDGAARGW